MLYFVYKIEGADGSVKLRCNNDYLPLNEGARFSKKAESPSR
ncbi:MAG: hypothetical protein EFKGCFLK_00403 [Rhodocyclaceae bacterium]|nr:hypothetical protein [Rhodocyclaceae bacterium]CAG0941268.1 hypothetical protein GPROT2_01244 [Gammaproteobacteria bacterium]